MPAEGLAAEEGEGEADARVGDVERTPGRGRGRDDHFCRRAEGRAKSGEETAVEGCVEREGGSEERDHAAVGDGGAGSVPDVCADDENQSQKCLEKRSDRSLPSTTAGVKTRSADKADGTVTTAANAETLAPDKGYVTLSPTKTLERHCSQTIPECCRLPMTLESCLPTKMLQQSRPTEVMER